MFNKDNNLTGDKPIPYYGCILTAEQAKEIEFKEIICYETNGKTLFDIKDKDGNLTGQKMFYIVFK